MADELTAATVMRTRRLPAFEAPFLRAPEGARRVFLVTLGAACAPLLAGVVLFGWRAAVVACICVAACVIIEHVTYRVAHTPALGGRSHAYLTGVLLALTLPAFTPWYVAVIASAFAVIIGKAVFGGVGHFLWQPALVGRFAVAVMFPALLAPGDWPVLAQNRLLVGDVTDARTPMDYRGWQDRSAPEGADAFRLPHPRRALAKLTNRPTDAPPAYSGLAMPRLEMPGAAPAALHAPSPDRLPPMRDLVFGTRPGGIGETCIIVLLVAGGYLVYRDYVRWQLPVAFLASAWCVAAVAPVQLAGPSQTVETVWFPLLVEGLDVGFTYVNYQLLSGATVLAATFLITEMSSRPATVGGQVIFGAAAGALAMGLQLYVTAVPIPAYAAVLAMNTFAPWIERMWRPRVLGRRRLAWLGSLVHPFGERRPKR
ncbi:MAG: RnfABCDGE type electron transport complex subunit D [Phycisphaerae bacterium]|nr:RnfABCDGE type electron transport complex subunit D [Phycisphaerae bacterium]